MPIRPWRGTPDRNATAMGTSSRSSRRRSSANVPTFLVRELVSAIAPDVATTSARRVMSQGYHVPLGLHFRSARPGSNARTSGPHTYRVNLYARYGSFEAQPGKGQLLA